MKPRTGKKDDNSGKYKPVRVDYFINESETQNSEKTNSSGNSCARRYFTNKSEHTERWKK